MSRKFTNSRNSLEFSARCLAGNGVGAIPAHYARSFASDRLGGSVADAAGIGTAGLAGYAGLAGLEAAYLAASRDAVVMPASRPARRRATLAMLIRKLLPKRKRSGWPQVPRYIEAA